MIGFRDEAKEMIVWHRLIANFVLSQQPKQRFFVSQNVTFGQVIMEISFVQYHSQLVLIASLVLLSLEAVKQRRLDILSALPSQDLLYLFILHQLLFTFASLAQVAVALGDLPNFLKEQAFFILSPHEMSILYFETLLPPPPSAHCLKYQTAVVSRSQIIKIEDIFTAKLWEADSFLIRKLAIVGHQKVVVKLLKPLHLPQNMLAYLLLRTVFSQKYLQLFSLHYFGRVWHQNLSQALA